MSTVSLAVDQTCNECHGELGTLATGGLHPQQHLGNIGNKPYLSSIHFQALHACHILPLNDGQILFLKKIKYIDENYNLSQQVTAMVNRCFKKMLFQQKELLNFGANEIIL